MGEDLKIGTTILLLNGATSHDEALSPKEKERVRES
jgi:hypothetical protein